MTHINDILERIGVLEDELTRELEKRHEDLRGVIKALDAQYPGLAEHLEEETTVAIDGEIHESGNYVQPVQEGSEVFFIPKLEGG